MSWLLGPLALAKSGFGLLKGLAGWLLERPTLAVVLLLVMHVALHQFVIDPRLRDRADKWEEASAEWQKAAIAWRTAHDRVITDVARAREEAAQLDRQNAARVTREQAVTIERTSNAYQVRLADRDAALERLRGQLDLAAAAGGDGSGRAAIVPGDLAARCRAFGAADCDALLAALPDLLSEAEANTAKLIPLQEYVRGLLSIDFAGQQGEAP